MAKLNSEKRITPFEINFFFALIGLPVSATVSYFQGEIYTLYYVLFNPATVEFNFAALVWISGLSGIFITVATILTVTICGPSSLNAAGIIKDVGLTYVGFVLFEDAKATTNVLTGLLFSFCGALYFAY